MTHTMTDSAKPLWPPPLQSSVDPQRLSTMVKGIMLFSPLFVPFIMKKTGILLTTADVVELTNLMIGAGALVMTLYGFFRKVLSKRADSVVNVRTKE